MKCSQISWSRWALSTDSMWRCATEHQVPPEVEALEQQQEEEDARRRFSLQQHRCLQQRR